MNFPSSTNLGLLLLRLMLGAVGVFHGSQKLFSAFGGMGMNGFTEFLKSLNVPYPDVAAYLAACAEFAGGFFIALGILPRLAAIPFLITMAVAIATVHNKEFDASKGGMEYPLTLAVIALTIIIAGPGRFALLSPGNRPAAPSPAPK